MAQDTSGLTPEDLMWLAIQQARTGIAQGQSPFGCAIARDGTLLACRHNSVVADPDITAHAEINALRDACRHEGKWLLEGCVVATTCEPCPMCMAALHWARVDRVHFGATIADASEAGFNELNLSAAEVLKLGESRVQLVPGPLIEECRRLFQEWLQRPGRVAY